MKRESLLYQDKLIAAAREIIEFYFCVWIPKARLIFSSVLVVHPSSVVQLSVGLLCGQNSNQQSVTLTKIQARALERMSGAERRKHQQAREARNSPDSSCSLRHPRRATMRTPDRSRTFRWPHQGWRRLKDPERSATCSKLPLIVSLLWLTLALSEASQPSVPMCQHHRAFLEQQAGQSESHLGPSSAAPPAQDLIVCPKSSQYNNLPQFPPSHVSPTLERQQRQILKNLNASFIQHLQLSPSQPESSSQPEVIDDQLLNEIISPLMLDAAYERAKELIVRRRKFESELVRQGEFGFTFAHFLASSSIWAPN